MLVLLTIYLYNKYICYGYKGKNIYSNDGALTWWRHHVSTTPLASGRNDMELASTPKRTELALAPNCWKLVSTRSRVELASVSKCIELA